MDTILDTPNAIIDTINNSIIDMDFEKNWKVHAYLARHSNISLSIDENKIILAVDEAVTNVIEHGYDEQNDGSIEIDVVSAPAAFKITIRDTGKIFNPTSTPSLNVQDHVKMGRKKGLGIFLMRQIMDEVKYTFRDGVKNELILVKFIK